LEEAASSSQSASNQNQPDANSGLSNQDPQQPSPALEREATLSAAIAASTLVEEFDTFDDSDFSIDASGLQLPPEVLAQFEFEQQEQHTDPSSSTPVASSSSDDSSSSSSSSSSSASSSSSSASPSPRTHVLLMLRCVNRPPPNRLAPTLLTHSILLEPLRVEKTICVPKQVLLRAPLLEQK
jgi:hypothetical protein